MKPRRDADLDIETYAAAAAHLWHYGPSRSAEVLERLGIAQDAWAAADSRYTREMADELAREESTTADRFGLAASAAKKRLRQETPPIESLGTLLEPPAQPENVRREKATVAPASIDVAPTLPAQPEPQPPPSVPARSIEVPSFLRAAEAAPPQPPPPPAIELRPAAAPSAGPPLGTLPVFILPSSKSLPFAGSKTPSEVVQRAKAQAEAVKSPPNQASAPIGETIAPSDLAAVMQRVMPFSSKAPPATASPTPATPSIAKTPPAPSPSAPTATAAAPSPPPGVAPPTLTLEQYASLCEDLRTAGDRGAEVLRRYGLSEEAKRAVDDHWQRQFQLQPTTFLAWERARSTYRAWLSKRQG
jgi:hypothetical protein